MTEPKISAENRALQTEVGHVMRKLDALQADMKKFYEEQGWEYPNEVSEIH